MPHQVKWIAAADLVFERALFGLNFSLIFKMVCFALTGVTQ